MPGDTVFYSMAATDSSNQNIGLTWAGTVIAGWAANLTGLSVGSYGSQLVYLLTAN